MPAPSQNPELGASMRPLEEMKVTLYMDSDRRLMDKFSDTLLLVCTANVRNASRALEFEYKTKAILSDKLSQLALKKFCNPVHTLLQLWQPR